MHYMYYQADRVYCVLYWV